jgi:hypothetical protein
MGFYIECSTESTTRFLEKQLSSASYKIHDQHTINQNKLQHGMEIWQWNATVQLINANKREKIIKEKKDRHTGINCFSFIALWGFILRALRLPAAALPLEMHIFASSIFE